jgi:hypothetical protein
MIKPGPSLATEPTIQIDPGTMPKAAPAEPVRGMSVPPPQ